MTQNTGYTDTEIQSATSSLIRTTVRRPIDSLGVRSIEVTFNDVQEAASGLFLLNPTAPLYVIQLAASRLLEAVRTEAGLVTQLQAALVATGRKVFPITNLSPLSNAKAALFELSGAVSNRSSSFKNIESTPAFQRFASNVDAFLGENGANIKDSGKVVQTPQGARTQIRVLLPQVKAAHEETKRRALVLQNALDDYNALNLPTLAASGAISRSRETVARIVSLLSPQEPLARLESLRTVVLALLTTKAVLREIGSFTGPGPFFPLTGSGQAYSDEAHLAAPATLKADLFAPYNVKGSPVVNVSLNGAAPFALTLSDALYAEANGLFTHAFQPATTVLGTKPGPFNIVLGQNDFLQLYLYDPIGLAYVDVTAILSPNPAATAAQICIDINAAILAAGLAASYAATPVGAQVQIAALFLGPNARVVIGGVKATNTTLGFTQTGGYNFTQALGAGLVSRNSGPFNTLVNSQFQLSLFHPQAKQSVYLQITLTVGAAVPTAQIIADINAAIASAGLQASYQAFPIGASQLTINSLFVGQSAIVTIGGGNANTVLGYDPGEQKVGVDENRLLTIVVPGAPGSPYSVTFTAQTYSAPEVVAFLQPVLGPDFLVSVSGSEDKATVDIRFVGNVPSTFTASMTFPSDQPNSACDILGFLKDVPYSARSNTARQVAQNLRQLSQDLTAAAEVVPAPAGALLSARSDPTDGSRLVVYRFRGAVVAAVAGPTAISLTPTGTDTFTGLVVGDVVSIVDGVNTFSAWTITAVTPTSLTASGAFLPAAGACTVEIGPNLGALPGWVVEIPSGVNNGIYTINVVGPTSLALPFEFELDAALPSPKDPNLQSVFFTANVGQERLTVTSKDRTINSSVSMSGPGASLFFAAPPGFAAGTTPWLKLPIVVRGLGTDDLLEAYLTDYATPDQVFTITSVEGQVIGVTPNLSSTLAISFDPDVLPPFGRLRSTSYKKFFAMQTGLVTWATLPANSTRYFPELDRLINIVLVESNPTSVQIGDAVNQLQQLVAILLQDGSTNPPGTLEAILSAYQVPRVDSIDELVRTYREKGSARAVDILLEAQFSTFFGLDVYGVSYSGAMLGKLREIAQQDMPVRKVNRKVSTTSQLQSTSESPNFEYDTADADTSPKPDVPTSFEQVPHGPDPTDDS